MSVEAVIRGGDSCTDIYPQSNTARKSDLSRAVDAALHSVGQLASGLTPFDRDVLTVDLDEPDLQKTTLDVQALRSPAIALLVGECLGVRIADPDPLVGNWTLLTPPIEQIADA